MTPQEKGRQYEKRLEKEGRAKRQPFSGSAHYAKEDLITEHELIQAKYHEPSATMSIKQEWFDELRRHSVQVRRTGVLFLEWNNTEYTILLRKDYDIRVSFDEQLCKVCRAEEPVICKDCHVSRRNKTDATQSSG